MKRFKCIRQPGVPIIAVMIMVLIGTAVFNMGAACWASGGGEAGGPKGWVSTDTYRVMNFAVLAIALFFILKKPASKALGDRISSIKKQIHDLEQKKIAAEQDLEQFNQKLSLLEKEAEEIVEKYKQQGEMAKEKIIKAAETAAEKLQDQARRNMDHELKEATMKLQGDILEKALAKAELMIKDQISKDDHNRLIDDYLERVEAQ